MTTTAQATKRYNEDLEMSKILKSLGFNGIYAGRKGHGYWLVFQEYALGYKSISELKKLNDKNAIMSLVKNLEKYPRTDDFLYGFKSVRSF
jgi:hypothetical protein